MTGFFFPFHGFTPAIGLGLISLPVLALTIYARFPRTSPEPGVGSTSSELLISLYFNVFVGVVQSFEKIPALHAMAPTQTEATIQTHAAYSLSHSFVLFAGYRRDQVPPRAASCSSNEARYGELALVPFHYSVGRVNQAQLPAAAKFRALHESGCFVLPDPWDVGTAIYLEHLGFKALATTSAGFAFSRGKPDGGVSLDGMLRHIGEIAAATTLPVNADFLKAFTHEPEAVATNTNLCIAQGVAGLSIEDNTGNNPAPLRKKTGGRPHPRGASRHRCFRNSSSTNRAM